MSKDEPMTREEFVLESIKTLRKDRSKGIHAVFTGFNMAFEQHFGENSRETTDKMVAEGKIVVHPVRGGVMIYLPDDAPVRTSRADEVLKKLGLATK